MNNKLQMFKCSMLMIIAMSTGYIAWYLNELIRALNGISFALQALS